MRKDLSERLQKQLNFYRVVYRVLTHIVVWYIAWTVSRHFIDQTGFELIINFFDHIDLFGILGSSGLVIIILEKLIKRALK